MSIKGPSTACYLIIKSNRGLSKTVLLIEANTLLSGYHVAL